MNKCIVCNSFLTKEILKFENMPRAAQHMPTEHDLENEKGITLSLYECPFCGLVQFDAPPIEYYKDVIRATRVSPKFRKLRSEQYAKLVDHFNLDGKKILEVGCGAGEFLEIWKDFPVNAYGIEHSDELVRTAKKREINVSKGIIEKETDILLEAPFDAFVSFNFLEHQPNPVGMLRGIAANLSENGVGLLTVPSFDYFQERGSYYEFLRDHIAYYTEDSLKRIMEISGFSVIETSRFNEDTLEIIVKKRSAIKLVDYYGQKKRLEEELNDLLKPISDDEGEIVVWGASHQAFTILSTLHIEGEICAVIDSADFKWGKYTPATHIPIVAPQSLESINPKCIIIMAPGFSDEIFNLIMEQVPDIKRVITVIGAHAVLLKQEG